MARIAGRNARLYVGLASDSASASPVAFISDWNAEFATEKFDVTSYGDTGKAYVAGLPESSGSFSGYFDTASDQLYTAAKDGKARKWYFYPDHTVTTDYYFGTAFFDFSVAFPVAGAASISGNWAAATDVIKVAA